MQVDPDRVGRESGVGLWMVCLSIVSAGRAVDGAGEDGVVVEVLVVEVVIEVLLGEVLLVSRRRRRRMKVRSRRDARIVRWEIRMADGCGGVGEWVCWGQVCWCDVVW